MKVELLEEPQLTFGSGKPWIDAKSGLLSFGPSGYTEGAPASALVIRAGAIGTRNMVAQLRYFLERIRRRVSVSESTPPPSWKVDFPGLGVRSPLHFDIILEPDKIEYIDDQDEESALESENRLQRIEHSVNMYERKFSDLAATAHPLPQLVFIPLSGRLMQSCKDPAFEQDKIVYARRSMERGGLQNVPLLDFHNVLKVLGFPHQIASQVIRPKTLTLTEGPQDPATMAWNFAVAAYYKATGTPWKLVDLDERTCYVGISFYVEVGEGDAQMRASMAHVYLRTGESQVIRGKPFRWEGEPGRSPVLTPFQAQEILGDVIGLYQRQWGRLPNRVVVHKSTRFDDNERQGFERAATGIECLDLVHVYGGTFLRFFHSRSSYPPLRGTLISDPSGAPAALYTVGYIPALGTYPGSTVPEPIVFSCDRLDSSVGQVARDLMALTKLDWNNTDFCIRHPVTLAVSRKVADILSETRARKIEPPSPYRFYM